MAEILISLTIIGIIAAITLPSLRANINEKTWATQRKALYARMSQAISMMESLNGYGVDPNNEINTVNNATQTFITDGLLKVLEINNICDNAHLNDCGIVSKYKDTAGSKNNFPTTIRTLHIALGGSYSYSYPINETVHDSYSLPNTNAAAFETKNGESIAVFYQPNCRYSFDWANSNGTLFVYAAPYMCANFIYDLNGKKGPNTAGKDIGYITVFYPTDSEVVMPVPMNKDSLHENGSYTTDYASALKTCRLEGSDVRLPNNEELASMAINQNFSGMLHTVGGANAFYVSTTRTSQWKFLMANMAWSNIGYGNAIRARCIKR